MPIPWASCSMGFLRGSGFRQVHSLIYINALMQLLAV